MLVGEPCTPTTLTAELLPLYEYTVDASVFSIQKPEIQVDLCQTTCTVTYSSPSTYLWFSEQATEFQVYWTDPAIFNKAD